MGKRDFAVTVFLILFAAFLLGSFHQAAIGHYFLDILGNLPGRSVPPSPGEGTKNTCVYQEKANNDNDHCYGNCGKGQCCDYKPGSEKECLCKDNVNPCGDGLDEEGNPDPGEEAACLACMGYAEAGGTTIPDSCMWGAMCAAKNRVNNPDHKPPVSTACGAVSQGDGTQFNAYKCVCNSKDPNQKYCNCCSGNYPNDQEKAEADAAKAIAATLDCTGFDATHFNAAGQASWASKSKNCKKVTPPAGCSIFDFYQCSAP